MACLLSLTNTILLDRDGNDIPSKAEFRRLAAHTIGDLARVIARLLAIHTLLVAYSFIFVIVYQHTCSYL
jgi:hypothetical protein